MSTTLFQFDFTLPVVLIAFLAFAQVMKLLFFDPIQKIKAERSHAVNDINHQADLQTRVVFELEAKLKSEEMKTQRMVQDVYQTRVQAEQYSCQSKLSQRKEELASSLTSYIRDESKRLKEYQSSLEAHHNDLVAHIARKLLD
jgi:F0F1-type ATP synthase membrane subunit b/b'